MKRLSAVFLVILILGAALLATGCGGGDGGGVSTNSSGDITQTDSNVFVLRPNVKELPDDGSVTIAEITDETVTLTGDVPPLEPGDVVIDNEGDDQFLRKVVSVTTEGGSTVVTTGPAVMTDVFESAEIQETVELGPEFLGSLQPTMPGVTFGEPEQVNARGEEFAAWRLPIHFGDAIIADSGRGSLIGNGDITIRLGLYKALSVGVRNFVVPTVNHFALVPEVTVEGNLTVTGKGSGDFRQEFPLTGPFSYPIAGFGPVSLNLNGQLMVTVDGFVQADASMQMNGSVKLECGIEAVADQWRAVGNFTPVFSVEPPALRANAAMNVSLIQPRLSIGLLGMGDAWVNANLLRLEAEAQVRQTEYYVAVYRSFGVEAGAHLALGIHPLVVRYDGLVQLPFPGRTLIQEFGTPIPAPPSNVLFTIVAPGELTMRKGQEQVFLTLSFLQVQAGPAFILIPIPQASNWTASNSNILDVRGYGFFSLVKAVGTGRAEVRSASPDGNTGLAIVQVNGPSLTGIQILPDTSNAREALRTRGVDGGVADRILAAVAQDSVKELGTVNYRAVGVYSDSSTADLTYSGTWSSDNGHALPYRNGQVDGRLEGSSEITVRDPLSGMTGSATVTVTRPRIRDLYITPQQPDMFKMTSGTTLQVQASAWFSDNSIRKVTQQVEWYAGDESVLSVNAGLITALAPGRSALLAFDPVTSSFDIRMVEVGAAAMTGLTVTPAEPGPYRPGQSQQFRAFAKYADNSQKDVTNLALWRTNDNSFGTLSKTGLYSFFGCGDARVKALYNGFTGSTETFDCRGPVGVLVKQQPPASLAVGETIDLEIQVIDGYNEVWTEPVEVTLELSGGDPSANLGGTLTKTTSGGLATFTDLSVDRAGTGYRIQILSPGLSIGKTAAFDVEAAAPGHLFVSNGGAVTGTGGLTVLKLASDGTFTAAAGSPYDTASRPEGVVRVGNFVFVANGGNGAGRNSLTRYTYDPATGALSGRSDTAADTIAFSENQPIAMITNGSDALLTLALNDKVLFSWKVDSTTGALMQEDSLGLDWQAPHSLAFHDVAGSSADLVFVSDLLGNRIYVFSYNAATGFLTHVSGSPFSNPLIPTSGGGPTDMVEVGNFLYAINPSGDRLTSFTVNQQTGALSTLGITPVPGDFPSGLHAVGNLLYVGNRLSSDIAAFRVEANGSLTPLNGGVNFPVGEVHPHGFADVALSSGTALYVTTSNRLAAFLLNPTTGVLSALSGSPFSGFGLNSPGDVRH